MKIEVEEHRRLLKRYDRSGPRYTSYPTALHFHEGFDHVSYEARLAEANRQGADKPWSVYLHLPFCQKRCLFCACNVIISPRKQAVVSYLDEIAREIDLVAAHIPNRRRISQLHLGGGTPTYFAPDELGRLLDHLLERFELEPGAEASVEVDPRVTTVEHLEVLVARGFNRVSLGVQDFDADVQEAVGRQQPLEQTRSLVEACRRLELESINFDLIYGLPHQTPQSFARTLELALEMAPTRLAIYGFAYVPWMKGHQKKLNNGALPQRDARFELLATARATLAQAGYVDIGMDHFALPEDELAVAQRQGRLWRNFMGYTVCKAPDMLGFGISAIGDVQGAFVQNVRKLSTYRKALAEGRLPVERGYALNEDDKLRQSVIRELMCHGRIDKAQIEQIFDIDFDHTFANELKALQKDAQAGLVTLKRQKVEATELGRLFVRNLAMPFDRHLNVAQGAERYSRTV